MVKHPCHSLFHDKHLELIYAFYIFEYIPEKLFFFIREQRFRYFKHDRMVCQLSQRDHSFFVRIRADAVKFIPIFVHSLNMFFITQI